jgi:hypothetical protein
VPRGGPLVTPTAECDVHLVLRTVQYELEELLVLASYSGVASTSSDTVVLACKQALPREAHRSLLQVL